MLPLAACGKKGEPLPPLSHVPLTTTDLGVSQQGRLILLDMSYPSTTVSGLALQGIDSVELLELVKPAPGDTLPTADLREFEAGATTLLTLRGTELAAAVNGDRIQFRLPLTDELPAEPVANIFAVRTTKAEHVSAISNRAVLLPVEPPPAPRNLQVTAKGNGVIITWEAEGAEGFDIFRREAQLRTYGEPVARVGGEARQYRDKSARFGQRYIYSVRSVVSTAPPVYSDPAGEREIEYEDRFHPPLPRNLVLLAERASIRLRWDASRADDVAGYIIYRREPGRNFHPITEQPVTGTEYLDANLASGLTYGYRIRVIDHSGNESPLSDPLETTAR